MPPSVHGLELAAQQRDLLAALQGVRHALGRGLVVAWIAPQRKSMPGETHQPVVDKVLPSASVTVRACGSIAVAADSATVMPSRC